MDAKMQLLVEAPAAVEDALASLLDDADPQLQVTAYAECRLLQSHHPISTPALHEWCTQATASRRIE